MRIPRRHVPLLASLAACGLLYAAAAVRYADENFFTLAVSLNFLHDNAVLGLAAVGMTFVILSGGIDLSVGAVMSLSSVVIGVLIMDAGWPPLAAVAAALLIGATLGAGMGCIVHVAQIKPFIVTLAGMFFARGLGFLIHLESIGISDPRHASLAGLAISCGPVYLPAPSVLFLTAILAGTYLSLFTSFGRNVYALGGSEEAALLMGLPVGRTKIGVYTLCGSCSALAGAVLTLYLSSGSHIEGVGLELDAIAAVVIGGTLLTGGVGSVPGTMIGVLIIGIILNVMTYERFTSGMTKVVIGGLLLAFVLLQRILTRGARRQT